MSLFARACVFGVCTDAAAGDGRVEVCKTNGVGIRPAQLERLGPLVDKTSGGARCQLNERRETATQMLPTVISFLKLTGLFRRSLYSLCHWWKRSNQSEAVLKRNGSMSLYTRNG